MIEISFSTPVGLQKDAVDLFEVDSLGAVANSRLESSVLALEFDFSSPSDCTFNSRSRCLTSYWHGGQLPSWRRYSDF